MTEEQDLSLETQSLGRVLESQRQKIRQRFLIHGLGWIIAATSAGILVYYLLDRSLALPSWVRILLSAACLSYLVLGIRSRVLYPWTRKFGESDVALAIERRFPGLEQRLISALQLGRSLENENLRGQSPAMIRKVLAQAAEETPQIPFDQLLDREKTVKAWGLAGGLLAAILIGMAMYPAYAGAFAQRIFGLSADYPRLTHLEIVLPESSEDFRVIQDSETEARIIMAAGGDLHIGVEVAGEIPEDVQLVVTGGRGLPSEVGMTERGAGYYRHVFRRVQKAFSFHAQGGDDPRGNMSVSVTTMSPPQVQNIRAELSYPAYTKRPAEIVSGGGIEALTGTKVRLFVAMTSEVEDAKLLFLNTGREVELTSTVIEDDAGSKTVFLGDFIVEESDSYQVEMRSPNGLRNPRPGSYPVNALADHAPIGQLLIPAADDLNVVLPQAILPIRLAASDDYGLSKATASLQPSRGEAAQAFELLSDTDEPGSLQESRVLTRLIEVASLEGRDTNSGAGESITVSVELADNRLPEALSTTLPPRQVHVVAPTDLARRIAGHFRRIREDVDKTLGLQRDRMLRTIDSLEELQAGAGPKALGSMLITIEVGQGRILVSARRIHREFMRSFNVHLFNRLEESIHAQKVMDMYLEFHRQNEDREAFIPEFYRGVERERRQGSLGAMAKTLDPILGMTATADMISNDLAADALRALESAGVASDRASLERELLRASEIQGRIVKELESLYGRLSDWNEFQDVISNTRALRDKQKDVQDRTLSIQGGKKK